MNTAFLIKMAPPDETGEMASSRKWEMEMVFPGAEDEHNPDTTQHNTTLRHETEN